MNNIKLVNQRSDNDCVLACVAMVANVSYEDAFKAFEGYEAPYSDISLARALLRLGLWYDIGNLKMGIRGETYLVTVPSLNIKAVNHCIVLQLDEKGWGKIFDPQNGRANKLFYKNYTECLGVSGFERIEYFGKTF